MPATIKHYTTSISRTGQDYADLHNWIDDAEKKYERHDFKKIWLYGPEIAAKYGEEGVQEYIEHLREDMENKISKLVPGQKEILKEAFIYFGIIS